MKSEEKLRHIDYSWFDLIGKLKNGSKNASTQLMPLVVVVFPLILKQYCPCFCLRDHRSWTESLRQINISTTICCTWVSLFTARSTKWPVAIHAEQKKVQQCFSLSCDILCSPRLLSVRGILFTTAIKFPELTALRRSAFAFACLKRGSSFVMVYWWSICSVFALYVSWEWQTLVWEDTR